MKKMIRFWGLVACAASLLVSCQKEELVDNTSSTELIEYSAIAIYAPETKTFLDYNEGKYKVKWSDQETVAVLEEANYSSGSSIVARAESKDEEVVEENKMSFKISFKEKKDAIGFNYYAVYSNKALPEKTSYDLSRVEVNLSSTQKPTATSFDADADILLSNKIEATQEYTANNGLLFIFTRPIAIGEMTVANIKDLDEGEQISRITFIAGTSERKINISGKSYFNFKKSDVERRDDGSKKYGTDNTIVLDYSDGLPVKIDNGKGTAKAYFTAWPFKISGKQNQSFSVKVETDRHIYTRTFTLTGDNSLSFTEGNICRFTVSLANADIEEKEYKTVLPGQVEEDVFIVSSGDKMMTAGENANYFNSKPIITEKNTDGKLIVKEENLSSAWKIVFDKSRNTYKISSINNPGKYVYGAQDGNTLKLVDEKDATEFSITENAGDYNITIGTSNRYITCGTDNFSMRFKGELINTTLKLSPAVVSPVIKVQETLGIKSEGESITIPVSYVNVDISTVEVSDNSDWLTANINEDKSVINISAAKNESGPKTAMVTISGTGENGETVSKTVKVTQYGTAIYHASLDASELKEARANGEWIDNKEFECVQQNGASWVILGGSNNNASYFQQDNRQYIRLPKLARAIKTVTVNMFDKNFSGVIWLEADGVRCSDEKEYGSTRYVLDIKTNVNNDSYISLKVNKMFKIKSIEVETREPLAAPTGLKVDGKTLSWNPVADAAAYDVTVGSKTVSGIEGTSYAFDDIADEYYDVTVVAIADEHSNDYINSSAAESKGLKFGTPKLQAPVVIVEGITATTLKIKWAAVEKASKYEYKINNGEDSFEVVADNSSYYTAQFTNLIAGSQYTVEVTAKYSDETVYGSSSTTIGGTLPNVFLDGDGSADAPYTVNDVIELDKNGLLNLAGKYVKGSVTERVLNGGQMTYTITSGGKTWPVTGNDLGNAAFSDVAELPVGAEVKIYYTDNTNNYLYSIDGETAILTGIKVISGQTTFDYGANFVEPEVNGTYRGKADEKITGCTFKIGERVITNESLLENSGKQPVIVEYKGFNDSYVINVKAEGKKTYTHRFETGVNDEALTENTSGGITTNLNNFIYKAAADGGFVRSNKKEGTITTQIPERITRIKFYFNNYMPSTDDQGIAVKLLINGVEKKSFTISAKGDMIIDFENTQAKAEYKLLFGESLTRVDIKSITFTNEK